MWSRAGFSNEFGDILSFDNLKHLKEFIFEPANVLLSPNKSIPKSSSFKRSIFNIFFEFKENSTSLPLLFRASISPSTISQPFSSKTRSMSRIPRWIQYSKFVWWIRIHKTRRDKSMMTQKGLSTDCLLHLAGSEWRIFWWRKTVVMYELCGFPGPKRERRKTNDSCQLKEKGRRVERQLFCFLAPFLNESSESTH